MAGVDADMDMMGTSASDPADTITTDATARVMSVSEDGDFITLDHDPIDAIGMGAMRMGFEVADDVDLSTLMPGDSVAFRVRATSDDIVLTALCRPDTDGPDCLG